MWWSKSKLSSIGKEQWYFSIYLAKIILKFYWLDCLFSERSTLFPTLEHRCSGNAGHWMRPTHYTSFAVSKVKSPGVEDPVGIFVGSTSVDPSFLPFWSGGSILGMGKPYFLFFFLTFFLPKSARATRWDDLPSSYESYWSLWLP